jgi:hypothetical protein
MTRPTTVVNVRGMTDADLEREGVVYVGRPTRRAKAAARVTRWATRSSAKAPWTATSTTSSPARTCWRCCRRSRAGRLGVGAGVGVPASRT